MHVVEPRQREAQRRARPQGAPARAPQQDPRHVLEGGPAPDAEDGADREVGVDDLHDAQRRVGDGEAAAAAAERAREVAADDRARRADARGDDRARARGGERGADAE